jgi:hypothetical protein
VPLAHRHPTPQSVPAQVSAALARGGLNRVGAAGILGNAYAESSWNPSATGYGGGGLWGFTASPNSLADLQAYASKHGRPWTDATLQTEFLLQHVSGSLIRKLNAAPTPEKAAVIFMSEFERPGIPRQDVRESAARRAFGMAFPGASSSPSRQPSAARPETSGSAGSAGGFGADLMHIGLVGALVLGGAGMVGLGVTRMLGTSQQGRAK